jgi:hypothetical protein
MRSRSLARVVIASLAVSVVMTLGCGKPPSGPSPPPSSPFSVQSISPSDGPTVVANGEFSFARSGGVSITGRILSATYASGSLNMPSCGSRQWTAGSRSSRVSKEVLC